MISKPAGVGNGCLDVIRSLTLHRVTTLTHLVTLLHIKKYHRIPLQVTPENFTGNKGARAERKK